MPESTTNGAGAGLQLRDWLAEPESPAELPAAREPNHPQPQPQPSAPPPAITERQRRQAVSDAALVVPDMVRLQLDTALFGDRSPHGSAGPDGAPRSKNLTVLVGTVRVRTNRRGQTQREITDLGAVRYRYELSINEVFASATGVAYENYRFPITMPDAVLARCGDLLVDGQRVAVLGPIALDVTYDSRFQTDAYDAGRRTWDIRIDVLGVQEIGDDVPDMAWVQLEGEVVDRPRVYSRQYGDRRTLVEHYAGVTLRYREVLAASFGRAVRPVVKSIPVEVLISADEEIIPGSDALLRPGNLVRIEGRFSPSTFRLPRAALEDATVQTALERTRTQFETRNADLQQRQEASRRDRQTGQERPARDGAASNAPRQQPLNGEALERQIARAQQRLLTGRRVRVEIGYVELLHGEAATIEERRRLIAESEERRRARPAPRQQASQLVDETARTQAQDDDTVNAMLADAHEPDADASVDGPDQGSDAFADRPRPRRPRAARSDTVGDEPVAL
jgi:hypothetical protein